MDSKEQQSKEIRKKKNFDDILEAVGGWGKFQYMITFVFFLFVIFNGYIIYSPVITLYTPPHFCKIPELSNLSIEEKKQIAIPPDHDIKGRLIPYLIAIIVKFNLDISRWI